MSRRRGQVGESGRSSRAAMVVLLATTLTVTVSHLLAGLVLAATVSSATFSGAAGTATVGGTFYARSGRVLTMTVVTDASTNCVALTGAHTGSTNVPSDTTATTRTWTLSVSAATGADGARSTNVTAFDNPDCTGAQASVSRSYSVDNTGPTLSANVTPSANVSGWHNANVSITWSATDAGSGVASGPTPATDSQTVDTGSVSKTSTATDQVGNVGNGSVVIKLDKTPPTITGSRNPAANANGWNNTNVTVSFTCSDGRSGVRTCSGPTTLTSNVTGQSVVGNALDFASNTNSATVVVSIDKNAPTLTGAPATSPNSAGWYNGDVSVAWTCTDTGGSGFAAGACANSTISGEGTGLTSIKSVTDLAGNASSVATSSPPVNVDRTDPVTSASPVAAWNGVDVTVSLSPSDGLSGVATTSFKVDGGSAQTYSAGNKPSFSTTGMHSLEFWSVDNAGNVEAHQLLSVGIDKAPPSVSTSQSPAANANGWNNTNVTVSFACGDAASGVASCPGDLVVSTEGASQPVTGTGFDNVGNSTTATTSVSVDKTPPTVGGSASPAANGNGWNKANVTVTFSCSDALSGVDTCSGPQTLSAEGAGQTATGTATDNAGNSASASLTGINIDKTAPSLSGAPSTAPNGAGWYNSDVTVNWSCNDALSGVAGGCPTPFTVSGEGTNLSAGATVADRAGNSTSATVTGLRVDRTAPTTTATVPAPNGNGWYNAVTQVTLAAQDAMSGVATTFYAVDGAAAQAYSGAFAVGQGTHTVKFWSVDKAGNLEDSTTGHTVNLRVDTVGPVVSVTGVTAGATYQPGGYNASCSISDALSGVAAPATLRTSGGPTGAVTLTCAGAVDNAGNPQTSPASVTINVAATAPPTTFKFSGFKRPTLPRPWANLDKAGSAVPLKFSLGGNRGMNVFAPGYPRSWAYFCGFWACGSRAVPAPTSTNSFSYDAASDTYTYVWKTDRSFAGTCRVFEVKFVEGSTGSAFFCFW